MVVANVTISQKRKPMIKVKYKIPFGAITVPYITEDIVRSAQWYNTEIDKEQYLKTYTESEFPPLLSCKPEIEEIIISLDGNVSAEVICIEHSYDIETETPFLYVSVFLT